VDVYIIVRRGEKEAVGFDKLTRVPELLKPVYSAGPISVLEVDKAACREASGIGSHDSGE